MRLHFLFLGGHKEPWLQELTNTYQAKLSHFAETEIQRLKPGIEARDSQDNKKRHEGEAILKALKEDDWVVLLDEAGQELNSLQFSKKLVSYFETGRKRVVFVIGGAFGVHESVKKRANVCWTLSKLTMNHHIAQAQLLEQVYRAFAIWKNLPYHNE